METYSFVIHVDGVDLSGDYEDLFWPACNDATIAVIDGAMLLDFDREAPSMREAVGSAMADIEKAGAKVRGIEPQDALTSG